MNWMEFLAGVGFGVILVGCFNFVRWVIRMRREVARLKAAYPPERP